MIPHFILWKNGGKDATLIGVSEIGQLKVCIINNNKSFIYPKKQPISETKSNAGINR